MIKEYNNNLKKDPMFHIPWPDKNRTEFNTTFINPPDINAETQLISMAMDGTIYDTHLRTTHVERTRAKAVRLESFSGNQIFIH